MESVLLALAVLACPLSMGVMMWFMARGGRTQDPAPGTGQSVEQMREEQRRLEDEISRRERPGQHAASR